MAMSSGACGREVTKAIRESRKKRVCHGDDSHLNNSIMATCIDTAGVFRCSQVSC